MAATAAQSANRARNEALIKYLMEVRVNGQALAWAARAMEAINTARASLESFPFDLAARDAAHQLQEHAVDVWRYAKAFSGLDPSLASAPVAASSWTDLRKAIQRAYALMFAIDQVLSPEVRDTFLSVVADIATDAARAVPVIVKASLETAGELAGAAGAGVGGGLAAILKGTWPLLLAAVAVLAGALYLASTGASARLKGGS